MENTLSRTKCPVCRGISVQLGLKYADKAGTKKFAYQPKRKWGIHLFTVILSAKDALAQKYPAMTALY